MLAVKQKRLLTLLSLFIPLVLGAFLGVFKIEAAEAHVDSGIAPSVFNVSWRRMMWDFFDPGEPDGPEDNYGGMYPPLYYVAARAFGGFFGTTERSLRYFSFSVQLVLILLTWLSFPLLISGEHPWLRFFLTLAVASAPAHIWWAQVTKYIHFFTLLQAISLICAAWVLKKQTFGRLAMFVFSLVLIIYTHYIGFLFAAASYASLAGILLWRKSMGSLKRLILSGFVLMLCVLPLFFVIIPSHQKLQDRGGFPNLYPDQPAYQPVLLLRDFFTTYNYGPSLTVQPGAFDQIPAAIHLAFSGRVAVAVQMLWPYLPLVFGVLALGIGLVAAVWGLVRSSLAGVRQTALLFALVPALFMILSPVAGYVIYFPYIGVGTFCTFVILSLGWKTLNKRWVPLCLALAILAVFAVSLTQYYANQDLKYPRIRPVVSLFNQYEGDYDHAVISAWMANDYNMALEMDRLPESVTYEVAEDPLSLPFDELTHPGTVVFLAGSWDQQVAKLDFLRVHYPYMTSVLLDSWVGMEKGNIQIYAFKLWP